MVYTANVPTAAQTVAETQPIIAANFTDIATLIGVNHVGFDVADTGKHAFAQFPVQVAAPATGATEVAVYCKNSAVGAVPRLMMREPSNGTERQISGPIDLTAAAGCVPLFGGMCLQWGTTSGTWNTASNIAFSVPFKVNGVNTAPYSITANQQYLGGGVREYVQISTITATTFTPVLVESSGGLVGGVRRLYWIAIGPNT